MPSFQSRHAIFFNDFKNAYIPQILEETYIKKVYLQFVEGRKDMTIVDIGGNIGLTSFYFKDYAKHVYCVEPAKEHIATITDLITYNKIDNITICPYALSDTNGTTKFYHNDNATMFSMEDTVNKKDDFEEVDTIDMETFMTTYKLDSIDLLKLDPEGSESKIITSKSFEKMCPKIKVICGEWHQWTQMNKTQFMNHFRDLGYDFQWRNDTQASVYQAVRI